VSRKCSHTACLAPDELGCKVGEGALQQCKYWQSSHDVPEQAAVSETDDSARLPWTGNAMGAGDIGFLSGASRTRLVGVFGVAESGKTSLLGAWYLLLGRGIGPQGISFAGSLSLEGWENIAGNLRWNAAHGPSFPPHTSSGSGRHPGLLHLDLQVDRGRQDLLFADAPGEWFSRWSVRRDAEDAAGAAWLSGSADVLLVIADSKELAGEQLGTARANLLSLLRRTGAERRGRPVALVWTKCDVAVDEQMCSAVKRAADLAFGTYETFRVSMHAAQGQDPYNRGQGLLELLDWVVRVDEVTFPKSVLPHPEQELLRVVGGVHA
jgi:hypothetical protein